MAGEFVGHDETANEAAHQERCEKWELYMQCVDRGDVTFEEAMHAYVLDMQSIGALALKKA